MELVKRKLVDLRKFCSQDDDNVVVTCVDERLDIRWDYNKILEDNDVFRLRFCIVLVQFFGEIFIFQLFRYKFIKMRV